MARTLRFLTLVVSLLMSVHLCLAQQETKTVRFEIDPPDADVYVEAVNEEGLTFVGSAAEPVVLSRENHFGEDNLATFYLRSDGYEERTLPSVAWSKFSDGKPFVTRLSLPLEESAGYWDRYQNMRRQSPRVDVFLGLAVLMLAGIGFGLVYLVKLNRKARLTNEQTKVAQNRGLSLGQTFGGYYLKNKIGAGGGGEVSRAVPIDNPGKENDVALKKMNAQFASDNHFQERFNREITTTSRLTHPNVIKIYDSGIEEGCLYFTMELLEGINVETLTQNSGIGVDPKLAGKIVSGAAKGLHHAHLQGLVHRDVKGDNLFIRKKNQTVVVIDFGCARKPKETIQLTQNGHIPGTKLYMPPESMKIVKAEDEQKYFTQAYDQFSLATVAFEMLTKRRPFYCSPERLQETFMAESIFFESIHSVTKFREDLSTEFDAIFEKALAREPEQRFPTIIAFAEEFERVCQKQGKQTPTVSG
jgi:serine/threonine protein kinase